MFTGQGVRRDVRSPSSVESERESMMTLTIKQQSDRSHDRSGKWKRGEYRPNRKGQ